MEGRKDPYRQFRFRVVIDGITQAGFSECTFGDTTADPAAPEQGRMHPFTITLRGGITDSKGLHDWRRKAMDGGAFQARKNISVLLVDRTGKIQAQWNIHDAWPSLCNPQDFPHGGSMAAIAVLEIVHGGFDRVRQVDDGIPYSDIEDPPAS